MAVFMDMFNNFISNKNMPKNMENYGNIGTQKFLPYSFQIISEYTSPQNH